MAQDESRYIDGGLLLGDRLVAHIDQWTEVRVQVVTIYKADEGIEVVKIKGEILTKFQGESVSYENLIINSPTPSCVLSDGLAASYCLVG